MTGTTHLTFGVASVLALTQVVNPPLHPAYLAIALLGSIAPDIDAQRSLLHSPSAILKHIMPKRCTAVFDGAAKGVAWALRLFFSHRGVLHSPFLAVCLLCLAYRIDSPLLFWFGFAYSGHIILDFCTSAGIPFFRLFRTEHIVASPSVLDRIPKHCSVQHLSGISFGPCIAMSLGCLAFKRLR